MQWSKRAPRALYVGCLIGVLGAGAALAEPTEITVRVLSKGAKFVGSSVGGARVVVRDAETGEVLAEGTTDGSTGSTDKIMRRPRTRNTPVATRGAAAFRATLDLSEPRRIEVEATGPLGRPEASNRVSATQWILPGKHITAGDAWLLELPGFVVDVLDPPTQPRRTTEGPVRVLAMVTMMCGCPIEAGGLWDANRLEVGAILERDGEPYREIPLSYAGRTSHFEVRLSDLDPGTYEATVYAFDPANGNTGLGRTRWVVPR